MAREFVIERTNETKREWWNGSGWTEDDQEAVWYGFEPDAPAETEDENARPVEYASGRIAET